MNVIRILNNMCATAVKKKKKLSKDLNDGKKILRDFYNVPKKSKLNKAFIGEVKLPSR